MEFEAILARIKSAGLAYRSSPVGPDDFNINHAFGGNAPAPNPSIEATFSSNLRLLPAAPRLKR